MNIADLHEAVRNTYPDPNYTYLREVRDATGFDAVRSADGIAIGMYRASGRRIIGFEMKMSRADWKKEMSDHGKAESMMRFCNQWALIVPEHTLINANELPAGWGMGVPSQSRANAKSRIKWIVEPPMLKPESYSPIFLTALIYAARRAEKSAQSDNVSESYSRGYTAGQEHERNNRVDRNRDNLMERLNLFEELTGISLTRHCLDSTVKDCAMTFKDYRQRKGRINNFVDGMRWAKSNLERLAVDMGSVIEKVGGDASEKET